MGNVKNADILNNAQWILNLVCACGLLWKCRVYN